MFYALILALPAICVRANGCFFWGVSLISCLPGVLLKYCLIDFEMVPFFLIITGNLLLLLLLLLLLSSLLLHYCKFNLVQFIGTTS